MSDTGIKEFLREHPRMIGVLFTMMLLLTQSGSAAASAMGTTIS
jgi:hypothetical protein